MLSILCIGLVYLAFDESAKLNQIKKIKKLKKKNEEKDITEKENKFTEK